VIQPCQQLLALAGSVSAPLRATFPPEAAGEAEPEIENV